MATNTVVPQQQQTPAPGSSTVGTGHTPAPNDQAAAAAQSGRGKISAAALGGTPWIGALGTNVPPDGGKPSLHKVEDVRRNAYKLVVRDVQGLDKARTYLEDIGAGNEYQAALREIATNVTTDKPAFQQLRDTIIALTNNVAGGDLGGASVRILATLALLTEDGKDYLRLTDKTSVNPPPIVDKLVTFIATKIPNTVDDESNRTRAAYQGLVSAIQSPHSAVEGKSGAITPEPMTPAELTSVNLLVKEIKDALPAAGAVAATSKDVSKLSTTPAVMQKILGAIKAATPRVREYLYAWRDEKTHKGVLELLGTHLSPTQVEQVAEAMDPVEQLYKDLSDIRNGRRDPKAPKIGEFECARDFLLAHLSDKAVRLRVQSHAPLMQQFIQWWPNADNRKVILRMLVSGRMDPDAVDRLHEAADHGDSSAAITAIYELGQTPGRLAELRSDEIFVHRLKDKCNKRVSWNGIETTAYDLFLRMNNIDPNNTKEAGSIDKQGAVDPNNAQHVQLTPQERGELDGQLYEPHATKVAKELSSTFYVDDAVVLKELHEFQTKAAAKTEVLRKAGEAPGSTLANRIQAHGCDVRLKVQRHLSKQNIVEAERILGFVVDQAAIGVVGGEVKLATDKGPGNGEKKIPLEQALRETLVDGKVLTQIIHDTALALANELDRFWGTRADVVSQIWNDFVRVVNDGVCTNLRTATGLQRVWAIELVSNSFTQVSTGTLQAKLQKELGKEHNDVITRMGMQPTDVAARRTMAEGKKDQTAANENDAHKAVEAAAELEKYKAPAAELFNGLANLTLNSKDDVLRGLGDKLKAGINLHINAVPASAANVSSEPVKAPVAEHDVSAVPGGPAHAGQPAPTDFVSYYKREFGIDPRVHAGQLATALATKERNVAYVGGLLGVVAPDGQLFKAPSTPQDKLEITDETRTLVGPNFTVDEAKKRAGNMWNLLHDNGQIQLIRKEIDGCTQEEQRLIHIAFRGLSGGIELAFFIQQHLAQADKEAAARAANANGVPADVPLAVGGGDKALHVVGTKAESSMLIEVAQNGRVSIEKRIAGDVAANNMNDVYAAIEAASEADRKAILANDALMNQLRGFGDDSYEWNRIYKGLTGQMDLFDKLESRAHGRHGFLGGFEGTDEKGMSQDIKDHAKARKKAIQKEVTERVCAKNDPVGVPNSREQMKQINEQAETQFKNEFQSLIENPEIRAILKDELSGTELSSRESLIMNAGEESKIASALTEGDFTEDEEKILEDIKHMSPAERKKARENPEYIAQLHKAIQSQGTWRDAMIALQSEEDGSKGENDDNFGILERASRSEKQDKTELLFEQKKVIEALSKLTASEFKRLKADPRLQAQILTSLEGYPDLLAQARAILAYDPQAEMANIGIPTGPADPAKGVYPEEQVERLAFLVFSAKNQLVVGAGRGWGVLLQAAEAIYNMKLTPGGEKKPEGGPKPDGPTPNELPKPPPTGGPQAGAPPTGGPQYAAQPNGGAHAAAKPDEAAAPDPKAGEKAIDKKLRAQILADTTELIKKATSDWGTQKASDDKHNRIDIPADKQQTIIFGAITHDADPADALLLASTGVLGDDEDRIKETLRKASEEQLIREWTTIKVQAPNGGPSLQQKYDAWRTARLNAKLDLKQKNKVPKVNSEEWQTRTAFRAHVIDTSAVLEDLLLKYTGGLLADDGKTDQGSTRVRDNGEWLEWRTIVRERIPKIDRELIGDEIGIAGDVDGRALIKDATLSNTLGQLEYDTERYEVDRGANSNYNMDRLTAGGEGLALDNAMGDYRREVMTSVIAKGPDANEKYGEIDEEEQGRIEESKARFNTADQDFRAAKSAVATVAATVVAIIVTAVVTILTAGTATGPLATILLATLTAGAASVGSNATRKAVQGTDFEFTREGLQNIARDTIMGAVTAGTMFYAGKIANSLFSASGAAEQAAIIGKVAADPSFLASMGRGMVENSLQTGMQGVFETGMAAFDPAMWLDGWSEGWRRGTEAARNRAQEIPLEMLKAAVVAAMSHSASTVVGKLKGGGGEEGGWHGQHEALGNRMDLADRTKLVTSTMAHGVEEGLIMGGTEILLDEKTYRADGNKPDEMLSHVAGSVGSMVQMSAGNLHMADAAGYQRVRAGTAELEAHGHELSPREKKIYTELITQKGGTGATVLSIGEFKQATHEMVAEGIATHEAKNEGQKLSSEHKAAYEKHVNSSESLKEYLERAKAGPSAAPGGPPPPAEHTFQTKEDCKAERERAEALISKLGPIAETSKGDALAVRDVGPQHQELMQNANELVKQIKASARTPADHEALADLVSRLNMASAQLANAMGTARSGSQVQFLHDQMKAQLELAAASPKDPKQHAALHTLVVAGGIREATAGSSGEAVATTGKKLAELKTLVTEIAAARDGAARRLGNHDSPPADPASVAVKTAEPTIAKDPATQDPRKQVDSKNPAQQAKDPAQPDQSKLTDPNKPADPTKQTEAQDPSKHTEPTKAADPTTQAVDPTKQAEPGKHTPQDKPFDKATFDATKLGEQQRLGRELTVDEQHALEQILRTHGVEGAEALFHEWQALHVRESKMPAVSEQIARDKEQHAQTEVHNHITGVVSPEGFKAQLDALGITKQAGQLSDWQPMLDEILKLPGKHQYKMEADPTAPGSQRPVLDPATNKPIVEKRGVCGDALEQAKIADLKIKALEEKYRNPKLSELDRETIRQEVDKLAKSAVDKAMRASDETDFNSGYEIIDEVLKKFYGGAERNKMLAEAGAAPGSDMTNSAVQAAYREHFKGRDTVLARIEGAVAAQAEINKLTAPGAPPVDPKVLEPLRKKANAISEQMAYDAYLMDALQRLAEDNIRYSEQSTSANKLDARFDPEQMPWLKAKLEAKLLGEGKPDLAQRVHDLEVKHVAMMNTSDFGSFDPNVDMSDIKTNPKDKGGSLRPERVDEKEFDRRVDQAVRQALRPDAVGVDIAGMELKVFDAVGRARFKKLYEKLFEAVRANEKAGKPGNKAVLRPHVGEGAGDVEAGKHGHRDMDRQVTKGGELTHAARANENVEALLQVCEQIAAEHGGKLPPEVIVRFGHATHADPEQAARMAKLGIIAEVNLQSNIETGASSQTDHDLKGGDHHRGKEDGKTYEPAREGSLDDHSLRTLVFNNAEIILSTDGHGVMNTDLSNEFRQAFKTIKQVLANEVPVQITGKQASQERSRGGSVEDPGRAKVVDIYYSEMSPEKKALFEQAYQKFFETARKYYENRPRRTDGARSDGEPPRDPSTKDGGGGGGPNPARDPSRDLSTDPGAKDSAKVAAPGLTDTTAPKVGKDPIAESSKPETKDETKKDAAAELKGPTDQTKTEPPKSETTTGDATRTSAVRVPQTEAEKLDAKQLEASVAGLRTQFADEIAKHDTKLVGPPSDRPVLEQSPSDALIGLPTNVISPTGSAEDAMAQLKEKGIPRWGALTTAERAHETAFAASLEADLPNKVKDFLALSKDSAGRYNIEVDGAKKLYEAYGKKNAPEGDAQTETRLTANHALHPAAVAVARIAFLAALDEIAALPHDDPRRMVFVTNGGCASGKGSLSDIVSKNSGGKFDFGVKWDAAGEGDAQENGWILAAAKQKGVKVTYGFVESDPTVTYNGVLDRALSTGRIVDPVTFTRSYVRGQENMRAFLESPEYQEALANHQVETVGVFTGKFDKTIGPKGDFPNKRLLGDNGRIGAKDLPKPPDETEITKKSGEIFEKWLKAQIAAGKNVDAYVIGGLVNPQKFDPNAVVEKPQTTTAAAKDPTAAPTKDSSAPSPEDLKAAAKDDSGLANDGTGARAEATAKADAASGNPSETKVEPGSLETTVVAEIDRIAHSKGADRIDVAREILDGYRTRVPAQREQVSKALETALLDNLSQDAAEKLAEQLARYFNVDEGRTPADTIRRVVSLAVSA